MSNPFDDKDGVFLVLINAENQHSLWPDYITIPAGWDRGFGPASKQACLDYVETNWADMRPKSLIDAMERVDK